MDHAQSLPPELQLDARRIAATSFVIVLHLVVLMLLLLPGQRPAKPSLVEEHSMIVVPEIRKIPLQPLPLAPPRQTERQRPTPVQPVMPVDSTPSPVDLYVPPVPDLPHVVDSFETPAVPQAFAQIAADVAPIPPYPAQALKRRLSGEVLLRVRVDASGRPVEVSIETSSGWKILDDAARKFVLARWHFVPATQGGVAVEAQALVPINFVLDR